MSLYEQNLAFINKYNSSVYESIVGQNATSDNIEYLSDTDNYIISRSGNESVRVFMHSEYDQKRELDFMLRPIQASDATVILFGVGNGQPIFEIYNRFPKLKHLIIVEPNVEILRRFLYKYDFVKTFEVFNKASFIIGKTAENAQKMLDQLVFSADILEKKISLVAPIAYRTLYADYYSALEQGTVSALRFYRVNSATMEAFRSSWLINTFRNLKHVSPDVSIFRDMFKNIPAIIVSAGPSLQKNIHLLHEAKERALIIAVGSAMTILEAHGIVPHFRIAVDAAVENKMVFDKVDTSTCPLIYSDHLYFDVLSNYSGGKVHMPMPSNEVLINYIFGKARLAVLPVESGFSIANIALNLLIQWQCATIVLIGQDLCYTRGKLHAEGAWDQDIEDRYIKKDIEAIDIEGNSVFTDRAFLGMKKIFENTINANPKVRFLNATEGGLSISGAENVKLADLLENEFTVIPDLTAMIQRAIQIENVVLPEKAVKIDAVVTDIQSIVVDILSICDKVEAKYEKICQWLEKGMNRGRIEDETKKLKNLIARLNRLDFYNKAVMPVFKDKFHLRRQVVDVEDKDWRKQWISEIHILLLESQEVKEYLLRMQSLIEEYQGKKQLNIIFEN